MSKRKDKKRREKQAKNPQNWRTAKTADRHELYELSVQNVESEIDFIDQVWTNGGIGWPRLCEKTSAGHSPHVQNGLFVAMRTRPLELISTQRFCSGAVSIRL